MALSLCKLQLSLNAMRRCVGPNVTKNYSTKMDIHDQMIKLLRKKIGENGKSSARNNTLRRDIESFLI